MLAIQCSSKRHYTQRHERISLVNIYNAGLRFLLYQIHEMSISRINRPIPGMFVLI